MKMRPSGRIFIFTIFVNLLTTVSKGFPVFIHTFIYKRSIYIRMFTYFLGFYTFSMADKNLFS